MMVVIIEAPATVGVEVACAIDMVLHLGVSWKPSTVSMKFWHP